MLRANLSYFNFPQNINVVLTMEAFIFFKIVVLTRFESTRRLIQVRTFALAPLRGLRIRLENCLAGAALIDGPFANGQGNRHVDLGGMFTSE